MQKPSICSSEFHCVRGGLTIRGTCYHPEGDRLPIAIVSHGFMATQATTRHYAKQLAAWGYCAYCFDFNGGGVGSKSDGRTVDMTVLTEVEDLQAVIAFACAQPGCDPARLTLVGCSQGGFVSALCAARLGEKVENLVLFYPALCIPDDARRGKMMLCCFDPAHIPGEMRCGPMLLGREYAASAQKMDPFADIAPYTGRVLILHGLEDRIVAPAYARQAWQAYEASRSGRCELVFLQGAGHGFSRRYDRQALPLMQRFLMPDVPITVDLTASGLA